MTEDAEFMTGDPRWHDFLLGTSPLGLFLPGLKSAGHLAGMFSDMDARVALVWSPLSQCSGVIQAQT